MMKLSYLTRRCCGDRILACGASRRIAAVSRPRLCATMTSPCDFSKDATPPDGDDKVKFQRQAELWKNYVEHGQGATELFRSFLPDGKDEASTTISAQTFSTFLQEISHQGIGDDEFGELASKEEFGLQDFRSWIRHATHDWTVHV